MRNSSTNQVLEFIKRDKNVLAITGDLGNEIYDYIKIYYPKQYIDYGISECNMVASSAGLARQGKIPFIYSVTNFMSMRAFEFIRNTVCPFNANVKFLGRSAGFASSYLGMTHQGTEDIALLRSLPNMIIINPATPIEAREATKAIYDYEGACYLRLEGAGEPELFDEQYKFRIGKGQIIREGSDVTIISTGSIINEAVKAAEKLAEKKVSVQLINMPTIKPLDSEIIIQATLKTKNIITLEEHSIYGGLGSAVSEVLAENNCNARFERMGLKDSFVKGFGTREESLILNELDKNNIMYKIEEMLGMRETEK